MSDKISYASNDSWSWDRLIRDHEKNERQCSALLQSVRQGEAQASATSSLLLILAVTLADHLGVEDEIVDLTAAALDRGYGHAEATAMRRDLDDLRSD